jgi:hypothetical protein
LFLLSFEPTHTFVHRDYFVINEMEGYGFDRAEARWLITGKFAWDLRGPP